MLQQFADLLAQETGDNGGGSLVGTQTVSVGGTHDRGFQQTIVLIDTHQGFHHEGDEAEVLLGILARSMEQDTGIGREAPVVMLTRTVDAVERLLVEQHAETVLAGHLLHE